MNELKKRSLYYTRKEIKAFNDSIVESRLYTKRKIVSSSQTILFDNDLEELPPFRWPSSNWCTIDFELAKSFEHHRTIYPILDYTQQDQQQLFKSQPFIDLRKADHQNNLQYLAQAYISMYIIASQKYKFEVSARICNEISNLQKEIINSNSELWNKPSLIKYIRKKIRSAKIGFKENNKYTLTKPKPDELIRKVLNFRYKNNYSIADICESCKISRTKYYNIIHRDNLKEDIIILPRGRPLSENSLNEAEMNRIKYLLDIPTRSYTVPEICIDIEKKFNRHVTQNQVYYFIRNKLKYTYKRNHFKVPNAFGCEQNISKYRVCKQLIDFYYKGFNIISLDETGLNLGIAREYSYAKRGYNPFRSKSTSPITRHILMAITTRNIFAYNIRIKGHNEHSFIAFLIDLIKKIINLGPEYLNKSIIFMDNASFHKSSLVIKLLNLLPIQICFNAKAMCDYNPIEKLFAIIKRRLKAKKYKTM